MKSLYNRLIALNLALVMVLALLPFHAGAAASHYLYQVIRPNGAWSTYTSASLNLNYSPYCYGYTLVGWSLEKDGLPVTDPSQVPAATARDVSLYSIWGRSLSLTAMDGSSSRYTYGPIMVGDVRTTGGKGQGWNYSKGVLHLTQDYPGYPITASGDLLIRVSGHVTVTGTNGPAVNTVGGGLHIFAMDSLEDKLTLIGGADSAVRGKKSVVIESPANVELIAPQDLPASQMGIDYDDPRYASHTLLSNRTFAGSDASHAAQVDTINIYGSSDAGKTLQPYPSYLRFEAVDQETNALSIVLDPGEGQLPGLGVRETSTVSVSAKSADLTAYHHAVLPLSALPIPSRSGYIFLGWESVSDTGRCSGDTLKLSAPEVALRAVWKKDPGSGYVVFNGSGNTLNAAQLAHTNIDILPLENGKITLPGNSTDGFAGWYTRDIPLDSLAAAGYAEGLYHPGQRVSLPSGTTLYALYYPQQTAVVHGNGQHTAAGNDRVLVLESYLQTSSTTLTLYSQAADLQEIFRADGKVLLDFNTQPDGSGTYSGAAFEDVYAQWADAPKGSVLLYSDSPASSQGRYGKILTSAQAASFDPNDPYGFTWAGHDLEGWYSPRGSAVSSLPAPTPDGYIVLRGKWVPRTITYSGTGITANADPDGTVLIPDADNKAGQTFNGWNSNPDGSGTWYLPGERRELTASLTVYPQYLDTPDAGSWVLIRSSSGNGLYQLLETTPISGSNRVRITLPESETGWSFEIRDDWFGDVFGYYGGRTYEVTPGMILTEANATFHANGGTFLNGTQFRNAVCTGTSWSSLQLYPSLSDFESVPEGMVFKGWSAEKDLSDDTIVYQPGEQILQPITTPYYAIWEDPTAVNLCFSDLRDGEDHSSIVACKVGQILTIPDAVRTGYKLDGWSDGTVLWLPGDNYTVPAGGATLTAQWSKLADGELLVPFDMRNLENSMILLALYDEFDRCAQVLMVPADTISITVDVPFASYRFFCLSDDGTYRPLTPAEQS